RAPAARSIRGIGSPRPCWVKGCQMGDISVTSVTARAELVEAPFFLLAPDGEKDSPSTGSGRAASGFRRNRGDRSWPRRPPPAFPGSAGRRGAGGRGGAPRRDRR